MQGNITLLATFSIAKLRMLPAPRIRLPSDATLDRPNRAIRIPRSRGGAYTYPVDLCMWDSRRASDDNLCTRDARSGIARWAEARNRSKPDTRTGSPGRWSCSTRTRSTRRCSRSLAHACTCLCLSGTSFLPGYAPPILILWLLSDKVPASVLSHLLTVATRSSCNWPVHSFCKKIKIDHPVSRRLHFTGKRTL